MAGKILKVSSNDLYGNVDDRKLRIYACFEHTKYMNNYVVFSIDGDNSKLCYGSIHVKKDSLVIFSVKDNVKKYILEFIDEYLGDKLSNYKIINIDNLNKVELVSYSQMECDKLQLLDDKTIPKVIEVEKVKEEKPILLYILLVILTLFAIGITILYFKPEWFSVKYKSLECYNNVYDYNMELSYDIEKNIRFDLDDKVENISVIKIYTFLDSNKYYEFKDSDDKNKYFHNGETYNFVDEELTFKVFYQEESVIDDYEEMLTYLKRDGFDCVEREYEE